MPSPQRSWPERFRVTVRAGTGGPVAYSAVTWLTQEKAIAMAVAAHLRRHPEGDEIYDVEVEDLGPVARDAGCDGPRAQRSHRPLRVLILS